MLLPILGTLSLLGAVYFLMPLAIGVHHIGMFWPAALLLLAGMGAILMPVLQMDREIRRDVEEYAQLREAASLPAEAPSRLPDADAEGNPLDCRVQPSAAPPDRFTGADLAACQAQNDDFIAWLSIPGTPIDYPVVRTGDPDYYLNHTFSGRKSYLGTLFSLDGTDYETPGRNIGIYGHHIRSSGEAMFSPLLSYKDPEFCAAHAVIYLDSLYHSAAYRVFAAVNLRSGGTPPQPALPGMRTFLPLSVGRGRRRCTIRASNPARRMKF